MHKYGISKKLTESKKRIAQKMLVLALPDESIGTNRLKYERIRDVFRTLSNILDGTFDENS